MSTDFAPTLLGCLLFRNGILFLICGFYIGYTIITANTVVTVMSRIIMALAYTFLFKQELNRLGRRLENYPCVR